MGNSWDARQARGPEKNIRTWGQLGLTGEWADKPINPFGRPMKYHQQLRMERGVFDGSDKWNEKLREFAHDTKPEGGQKVSTVEMLSELGKDPYGIAFSDLGAATPNVKLLAISRGPGQPFVPVSLETTQDRSYPLISQSYLYLDRKPGQPVDPKVHEFLHYILSREGQAEVMRDAKFLPLTAAVAKAQIAKID
jgi:phosphate transport system substrate-binding protein